MFRVIYYICLFFLKEKHNVQYHFESRGLPKTSIEWHEVECINHLRYSIWYIYSFVNERNSTCPNSLKASIERFEFQQLIFLLIRILLIIN